MDKPSKKVPGAPAVTLAGKKWPIPELAVRQLRYVRAPIVELTDRINTAYEPVFKDGEIVGQRIKEGAVDPVVSLSVEDYDRLIVEVVWQGLTRAHPDITLDDVLDMTATPAELFSAWLVVRRQSRIYMPVGGASQGEAKAAD